MEFVIFYPQAKTKAQSETKSHSVPSRPITFKADTAFGFEDDGS